VDVDTDAPTLLCLPVDRVRLIRLGDAFEHRMHNSVQTQNCCCISAATEAPSASANLYRTASQTTLLAEPLSLSVASGLECTIHMLDLPSRLWNETQP
jgi:hypothetical protein